MARIVVTTARGAAADVRPSVPAERQCGAQARVSVAPGRKIVVLCTSEREHDLDGDHTHRAGTPVGRWAKQVRTAFTWPVA